jgi:hypothetical protein
MQIFRLIDGEPKEVYRFRVESNSTQRQVHMGEDVLNLYFEVTEPLDLRVNDFTLVGENNALAMYKFKKPAVPKKFSRHHFEYFCQLMGEQYDLEDALYVLADDTGVGELDDTIPLYGTLTFHLEQILRCVQEVHPYYKIGQVEDTGEEKNIVYNNMNCLEALQRLASEFKTEWWVHRRTMNMGVRREGNVATLEYGKGKSFYSLARQNQDGRIVTKLLVKGGTRNIDAATYGHAALRLPGGGKYVTANEDKYGTIMGRADFPDVYPRMIHKEAGDPGSVTAARANAYGIYYIKDANLGFNPADYMLPGLSIKVVFQTGQLAGMSIEANWHADAQEFELIRADYGLGIEVPGSVFVPATGDTYILEDIAMPEAYITAAEAELQQKAEAAIAQLCEPKVSYKATCNPLFFKHGGPYLTPGHAVIVSDPDVVPGGSVELRVQSVTRRLHSDYDIDIELSDTLYSGRIGKIETAIREVQDELVTVDKSVRKFSAPYRPVFRGDFATIPAGERIFYNNPNRRDSVWYNGQYYEYKGADAAVNAAWIASAWQPFQGQYGSLATDLLLAIGANIGGWIFNGEILEAQSGNAWLNGKTGEVKIAGRFESNRNGNRIIIDPEQRCLKMVSGNNREALNISFEEKEDGAWVSPDITLNHYSDDVIVSTTHIKGYEVTIKDEDGNQANIRPTSLEFFNSADGSQPSFSASRYFDSSTESDNLYVKMNKLPTSNPNQPGRIFRDGNNLKIS